MKKKLKATETTATNSDFYHLFRPIVPSIDIIGKVAQVVSAVTEGVTIWYITQSEMAGASKFLSITVSILAMLLVIGVLELGGRKFLQVLTRAIVWKQLKNAWYIALFSIVLLITMGMGVLSFHLSTNGIRHAFVSNVPVAAQFDDSALKQEHRTAVKDISTRFNTDFQGIKENYKERVASVSEQYDARIAEARRKEAGYRRKYAAGEKWARSQADKHAKRAGALETERAGKVAAMHDAHAKRLDGWQAKKDKAIASEKTRFERSAGKAEAALVKTHASKHENARFWGGLFSFFVGFSVVLAFICIVSVEVYRRGSGIRVEYTEEEQDEPIISIFWKALKARVSGFLRGWVERFANSGDALPNARPGLGFKHKHRPFATNSGNDGISAKGDLDAR